MTVVRSSQKYKLYDPVMLKKEILKLRNKIRENKKLIRDTYELIDGSYANISECRENIKWCYAEGFYDAIEGNKLEIETEYEQIDEWRLYIGGLRDDNDNYYKKIAELDNLIRTGH